MVCVNHLKNMQYPKHVYSVLLFILSRITISSGVFNLLMHEITAFLEIPLGTYAKQSFSDWIA